MSIMLNKTVNEHIVNDKLYDIKLLNKNGTITLKNRYV